VLQLNRSGAVASNEDIMRELGGLATAVRQLREDFHTERSEARDNRKRIHDRLDLQVREHSEVEGKIITVGLTLEQQRLSIERLAEKVDANQEAAQISADEWKRIKTLGCGFSGILVAVGVTGGGFLIWAGDISVALARKWLRID
jgi:hypothetical protein